MMSPNICLSNTMAHFQVYHEHWRYYTCYVSTIQLQFQYLISHVCVPLITATIRACHPSLCMCSKSTPDPLYSSIKPVCLRNISTALPQLHHPTTCTPRNKSTILIYKLRCFSTNLSESKAIMMYNISPGLLLKPVQV